MTDHPTLDIPTAGQRYPEGDPRRTVSAQGTHIGQVRKVNQDHCDAFVHGSAPMQLLVTADGMGGHRGGEVASRLAVEAVGECFASSAQASGELLRSALESANTRIFDTSGQRSEVAGMGSTGVALLFGGNARAWVANVGDSRAYRLRNGSFEQISEDHSVVAELVRAGAIAPEQARSHPRRNELRRALGVRPDVEIDLHEIRVEPGDRYLLCSDGLWGLVGDAEIARVLSEHEPEEAVRILIDRANEEGGHDNITVQIAVVPGPAPPGAPGLGSAREAATPEASAARRLPWGLVGLAGLTAAFLAFLLWLLLV